MFPSALLGRDRPVGYRCFVSSISDKLDIFDRSPECGSQQRHVMRQAAVSALVFSAVAAGAPAMSSLLTSTLEDLICASTTDKNCPSRP
jgi:hypothetical protein